MRRRRKVKGKNVVITTSTTWVRWRGEGEWIHVSVFHSIFSPFYSPPCLLWPCGETCSSSRPSCFSSWSPWELSGGETSGQNQQHLLLHPHIYSTAAAILVVLWRHGHKCQLLHYFSHNYPISTPNTQYLYPYMTYNQLIYSNIMNWTWGHAKCSIALYIFPSRSNIVTSSSSDGGWWKNQYIWYINVIPSQIHVTYIILKPIASSWGIYTYIF